MRDDFSPFARTIRDERYCHVKPDGTRETWREVAERVVSNVLGAVTVSRSIKRELIELIETRKFMPGGRYLYASGREFHQVQNCLLLRAEDTREGWAELFSKATLALMTGAGIGVDYSDLRGEGAPIKRTGGYSSGPIACMQGVNEIGRAAKSGGNRRAAIWAGLNWKHSDIFKFIDIKNWSPEIQTLKAQDWNFPAPMDHTNISVLLDDDFFVAYRDPGHTLHCHAHEVYSRVLVNACTSGDPGLSVDTGYNSGETLRNACTEVTSRDDSDICNLGSINMARIGSLAEMRRVVELGSLFLLAGTVYSDVPYPKVERVRERNRRLGLGLMGVAEFMARHGRYGDDVSCGVLGPYMDEYARSGIHAARWADSWSIARPVKTRAIAPTGTIGIVAETTTGIEPIFCASYKRRYYDHGVWRAQYVIDPTAKKLVADGVKSEDIEDAYSLSRDITRRIAFQAWAQVFVDHGISSTLNFPAWGSPENNPDRVHALGDQLIERLPYLRGITIYPDGARGGQPLTPAPFAEALAHEGEVITEQVDVCDLRGGSCGS